MSTQLEWTRKEAKTKPLNILASKVKNHQKNKKSKRITRNKNFEIVMFRSVFDKTTHNDWLIKIVSKLTFSGIWVKVLCYVVYVAHEVKHVKVGNQKPQVPSDFSNVTNDNSKNTNKNNKKWMKQTKITKMPKKKKKRKIKEKESLN